MHWQMLQADDSTFGSDRNSYSAPPHPVTVDAFRIGFYPVTNSAYVAFVRDTDRLWRSPDGFSDDRRNAPATDLTWHDARAYCDWLTHRWRAQGRISAGEFVRLPTEPEWERAARGDQPDMGADVLSYPWGHAWMDDAANSEEAGFNTTCTVGLFPKGRSPSGCYDMVGQVWEWCTTLWGDDMAGPDFKYPYSNDGREAVDAAPSIRRVLRGGCFSSGKLKACCTYRGSLEPGGFWRGNGFRIVVSG
nr:formylglycine-generating enzyme family protein [Agrobacterium sp. rho-8.1]